MHTAAASVVCDDSEWRLLDLPHEYIAEQAYSHRATKGPAALRQCRAVVATSLATWRTIGSTYPSQAWAKFTVLWIAFEDVFRATKIDLAQRRRHLRARRIRRRCPQRERRGRDGWWYTFFTARLDNCSAVQYGGNNVLTVYVDPRMGSG